MITTTSLVTIPMQSYYSIIGHIPYAIYYIPMAYLSYNRKCVLLLLHLFILSGVISLLLSSSILSTYQPGEFIFQCHIFLPFHTVHGVLKARILK